MSLRYRRAGLDVGQFITVEASLDGIAFVEVGRIEGSALQDRSYATVSFDIAGFASASTAVRFVASSSTGNTDLVFVDDVKVEYAQATNPDLDTPGSVSLGSVDVGSTSSVDVVLTNNGAPGDADIRIDAVSISGPDAARFAHDFVSPVVVEPGDSVTVAVSFAPTSAGSASATLSVAHTGVSTVSMVASNQTVSAAKARSSSRLTSRPIHASTEGRPGQIG